MKKVLSLLLAFVLCFSLISCGKDEEEPKEVMTEETMVDSTEETKEKNGAGEENLENSERLVIKGETVIEPKDLIHTELLLESGTGHVLTINDAFIHEENEETYFIIQSTYLNENDKSFIPMDVLFFSAFQDDEKLEYKGYVSGYTDDDQYIRDGDFVKVEPGESLGPLYDCYILASHSPIVLFLGTNDGNLNGDFSVTTFEDLPMR